METFKRSSLTDLKGEAYELFTITGTPSSVEQSVNDRVTNLPVMFEPSFSFPVPMTTHAMSRRHQELELERLKNRLLGSALSQTDNSSLRDNLMWAARDAAAVAWATPCSLLVFPLLFEENVAAAQHYARRQAQLLAGTEGRSTVAA
jgi:hypothetical protein